jgi:L-ribulose-5-phosphate 4-epimerase
MILENLRQAVLTAARQMVLDGIAHGAQGNISARDPETGLIAITPSAVLYAVMEVADICVIDAAGTLVEGRWRPTSETPMHTIFYRERPDVGAVVHSHAPYATVFGIIHEPIPMVLTEAATCLTGDVPVAPYARPGSPELAQLVLDTLAGGQVAVVLAHHGLLTVGPTLAQAYDSTLAAETSARLAIMARSMGATLHTVDPAECAVMREMYLTKYAPTAV